MLRGDPRLQSRLQAVLITGYAWSTPRSRRWSLGAMDYLEQAAGLCRVRRSATVQDEIERRRSVLSMERDLAGADLRRDRPRAADAGPVHADPPAGAARAAA